MFRRNCSCNCQERSLQPSRGRSTIITKAPMAKQLEGSQSNTGQQVLPRPRPHSARTFMLPDLAPADYTDRILQIDFLKTLVHWSLTTSEIIQSIIKESYKQARHEDDVNQPLSVQPWGLDTRKRKHYLIEGQVDSPFRVYRESEKKAREHTWKSVAGSIEDAQKLARDLRAETGQLPHRLAAKITQAVPLFEEKAEKRKRKEYRLSRKAAFARPEPGMSLYEGRTRGKRMNYAFDDDEIYGTDEMSTRRSERQSRVSTPADGPTFTASGRQVRSQFGKSYGEPSRLREGGSSTRASTRASSEAQDDPRGDGRARRSGRAQKAFGAEDFDSPDKLGNDDDDRATSGDQWDGDDEDMEGKLDEDEADEESDAGSEDSLGLEPPRSLVVKLRCGERLSGLNLANGQSTVPTAAHNHQSPRHTTDSQQPTTNDYSSPITNPSTSTPAPPIPSTVANAEQALDRPLQVSPSIPQQPRSQQSAGYPSHGAIKPLHQTTTRVPMLTTAAVHPLSSNAKEYPAQNRAAGAQPDQDTTGHPNQHPSHPSPANSHPAPSVTNGVQRPQQPARIPQSTHYSSHVNGY